ncbi:hypothetical protein PGT21_035397 [Puccinia graminis f. sp. tritici]|uniref:Uncharacterized protein n=1 Tax=Puccinia graminis f. sp. tritici TaxID=56615 RepID=A0A5B0RK12_PUCGR|nr:hypothetical protein PGT21_035397 [Puccinia graminis f. sp. tritici]KAA1126331.1 hypothetical protein PGTUg99_027319 [Puccinia graminis f. sp. tritici]
MNPSPPQLKPNTILILIPVKVCKGCPPSTTIPDQLAHQKPTTTHSQNWIALIEHGDSVFVDKVGYPQNSGAPAVIVCDWQQSPTISSSSLLTLTHILSSILWSTHNLRCRTPGTDRHGKVYVYQKIP